MLIRVTEQHIKEANEHRKIHLGKSLWDNCPIALAIREVFKNGVMVTKNTAHVGIGMHYRLCSEAIEFINKYDCKNEVGPFEFELGPAYNPKCQ